MIPKRTSLWCSACAALVLADAAAACDTPVCVVDPDTLALTQIITFDDQPASFGPGIHLDTVLDLNGARFGERFSGQSLSTTGTHDNVTGAALGPPLVLIAGDAGQNLALVHMGGAARTVLVGYGAAGFPKRDAQGEGAIAVQFDRTGAIPAPGWLQPRHAATGSPGRGQVRIFPQRRRIRHCRLCADKF